LYLTVAAGEKRLEVDLALGRFEVLTLKSATAMKEQRLHFAGAVL